LRGDGKLLIGEVDGARISTLICYDLDFPDLVAQAGELDIGILVGPAGDWPEIASIHAKMSRSRAIEQGVVLVRPTTGGVSIIYDGLGRVLAETHSIDDNVRHVTTWVPIHRRPTLYGYLAGALGWASILMALLLIGVRIARRKAPPWREK
jgi:apolipoprotein N-acyltransferase